MNFNKLSPYTIKNLKDKIKIYKKYLILDKHENKYIKHNKSKWKDYKNSSKNIILVDLFPWYPWIHLWSYLTNILSKKFNCSIKYFHFNLHDLNSNNFGINSSNYKKIYKSFNVSKGISEIDFIYTDKQKKIFNKNFKNLNFSKKNLLKYKKKDILLGDLIYDTYIRTNFVPTAEMNSDNMKKIFFRAEKIFSDTWDFFNKNNVKFIIPSHLCYISYGIISRIARKKKIPIIKIQSKFRGNSVFRIHLIDRYLVDEPPYYDYKKIFKKFTIVEKKYALSAGKKLLKNRISGNFDKELPYIPISQFRDFTYKKEIKKLTSVRPKIFIFPNCFFDNPHKYRSMIFNDFYEQIKFFLDLSLKMRNYDWYYKPHPNELGQDLRLHEKLLQNYPHINYLKKNVSHKQIIQSNPKCVITNHGTVAHEYASFKIPVICTGDNLHANYDFCIHAQSKKNLLKIMGNLDYYSKKINFDKKQIYEYLYLHYEYFPNLYEREELLKNEYFANKNVKINKSTKILNQCIKYSKISDEKIKKYINNFIDKNLLILRK